MFNLFSGNPASKNATAHIGRRAFKSASSSAKRRSLLPTLVYRNALSAVVKTRNFCCCCFAWGMRRMFGLYPPSSRFFSPLVQTMRGKKMTLQNENEKRRPPPAFTQLLMFYVRRKDNGSVWRVIAAFNWQQYNCAVGNVKACKGMSRPRII